jgi:Rod binding domain-containing protein
MADFSSALAVSPQLLTPQAQPVTAAELAKRGQIRDTAQKFETSFLSNMLQQMYTDVDTDGPFGGGQGEQMFRSFLTDAMAKQVVKAGGVGVAASVEREMLKMQGLK